MTYKEYKRLYRRFVLRPERMNEDAAFSLCARMIDNAVARARKEEREKVTTCLDCRTVALDSGPTLCEHCVGVRDEHGIDRNSRRRFHGGHHAS